MLIKLSHHKIIFTLKYRYKIKLYTPYYFNKIKCYILNSSQLQNNQHIQYPKMVSTVISATDKVLHYISTQNKFQNPRAIKASKDHTVMLRDLLYP